MDDFNKRETFLLILFVVLCIPGLLVFALSMFIAYAVLTLIGPLLGVNVKALLARVKENNKKKE